MTTNTKTATLLRAIVAAGLDGDAATATATLVDVLARRVGCWVDVQDLTLGEAATLVANRYAERSRRGPVCAELRAAGFITLALDVEEGLPLAGAVERLERWPDREGRAACLASLRAVMAEERAEAIAEIDGRASRFRVEVDAAGNIAAFKRDPDA